eukprot:TRINITY_DN5003_c0_g1_i1.p1 TRINITY_DN5003_c0_g1~~TRINITY_DN5003_c0_g1_i1.p1  ORF type:complete len:318 (-),score=41.67 TRINITY_DN5003_c0_g1_i1:52-1005(-)
MQSLLKLCIGTIARNFELVTSLIGVPDEVCLEIFKTLVSTQKKFTLFEVSLFSSTGNFLRELDLKESRISNDGLKYVGVVTTLVKLNLEGCSNITDNGLDHLAQLKNLLDLNLSRCSGVSDAGVSKICNSLPQIQHLNLSELLSLTEEGLASLSRNSNLKTLSLSHCKSVDSYAVRALTRRLKMPSSGGLISLKHLYLVNCPLSDAIVNELALFPSIKTLDLFGTKVTPKGIQILVDKLKHMEVKMGQCLVSKEQKGADEQKVVDVWGEFNFRQFFECKGYYFQSQIQAANSNQPKTSITIQQEKVAGIKRSFNKIS